MCSDKPDGVILLEDPDAPVHWSPYGFAWGPALIVRMMHRDKTDHGRSRRTYWLRVTTGRVSPGGSYGAVIDPPDAKHHVDIRWSDQGNRVSIWLDDKRLA